MEVAPLTGKFGFHLKVLVGETLQKDKVNMNSLGGPYHSLHVVYID